MTNFSSDGLFLPDNQLLRVASVIFNWSFMPGFFVAPRQMRQALPQDPGEIQTYRKKQDAPGSSRNEFQRALQTKASKGPPAHSKDSE